MLTFIVVFGALMVLLIMMVMIDRQAKRIERLEVFISGLRIEYVEDEE